MELLLKQPKIGLKIDVADEDGMTAVSKQEVYEYTAAAATTLPLLGGTTRPCRRERRNPLASTPFPPTQLAWTVVNGNPKATYMLLNAGADPTGQFDMLPEVRRCARRAGPSTIAHHIATTFV